jgi:hypothetical protein
MVSMECNLRVMLWGPIFQTFRYRLVLKKSANINIDHCSSNLVILSYYTSKLSLKYFKFFIVLFCFWKSPLKLIIIYQADTSFLN